MPQVLENAAMSTSNSSHSPSPSQALGGLWVLHVQVVSFLVGVGIVCGYQLIL